MTNFISTGSIYWISDKEIHILEEKATREYKISLNQIQLLSELGIELKIIHYNF